MRPIPRGAAWFFCAGKERCSVETGLAPSPRAPSRLSRPQDAASRVSTGESSECTLPRVVPGPVVRLIGAARRRVCQVYPQLAEFRIRIALGRIVGQQILRSQFFADLLEGAVQLRRRRGVVVLS